MQHPGKACSDEVRRSCAIGRRCQITGTRHTSSAHLSTLLVTSMKSGRFIGYLIAAWLLLPLIGVTFARDDNERAQAYVRAA